MDAYNESNKEVVFQPVVSSGKTAPVRTFRRTYIVFIVVVIVLLLIILGVVLALVLNRDDEPHHNRLSEFPVLLISLDGFRAEYLQRGITPNITNLGKNGVQANFLLTQFPTKTFPNHYTTVTGLYPESHGIVFNNFYDPDLNLKFSIRKSKNASFWGGEPIWLNAQKNGMKSASYFWVGSEVEGLQPTYYRVFNKSTPFSDIVDQVLKWLRLPVEERPSFITMYFHQPDSVGHKYGPNSIAVNETLRAVDDAIGQLLTGLADMKMSNLVNMIIVSDHGMAKTNCEQTILFPKYGVLEKDIKWTNLGSIASFTTRKGVDRQKTINKLKCANKSFQAFYKKKLPKRMHFSNNRRIDDIIVIGEPGVLMSFRAIDRTSRYCNMGAHGYDNIAREMRSIFMARGPSFQKGKTVDHFTSIEIYNLLAALLKIEPAPNNGTMGSLHGLLLPNHVPSLPQPSGDGNRFRTDICQFPNDNVFEERSKSTICSYCDLRKNVSKLNKVFNISSGKAKAYQTFHLPWGLPDGGAGVRGCLMTQPDFIIGYSTYLRIPLWAAHRLNGSLSTLSLMRQDCFRGDVRLMKNESGNCKSYRKSGFDRGHLVPYGDLDYEITVAQSTFTFANIAPQFSHFNRVIWLRLEKLVRRWASKYKEVYVISGSIFDNDEDGIRDDDTMPKRRTHDDPDNPAVPSHFYKIITRCDVNQNSEYTIPSCNGSLRVISFILRNTDDRCSLHSGKILLQNVARVKDIELLTGINFFAELPAQLQAEIETFLPVELWQ